jgi:FlaA1/EpsC-like NDP-sugar epimerase/lipopolysaccharide/colanic/teichoic acid biosynthesis glycosyltransferase
MWSPDSAADRIARRTLDVSVSALALLALAPALAVIALLVRLADGGPALFRQERIGRGGRPFRMLKFRSMRVDAERHGGLLTADGDERVTPVGRVLRRSKLDELPQLWNVLRGEMALVGPRPEVARYVARYDDAQRALLERRPGITDPASLAYIDESVQLAAAADPERHYVETLLPAKLAMNLDYAARATVWSDVALLARTAFAIARRLLPRFVLAWPRLLDTRTLVVADLLRRRRWVIAAIVVVLTVAGYASAYLLRYDFLVPASAARTLWRTVPLLLAVRMTVYAHFGLFRGYWQHFGFQDLLSVVAAATSSSLLFAVALLGLEVLPAVGRAILVLDWLIAIAMTGGAHFAARLVRERWVPLRGRPGRRALVVGAGEAAERLLRLCQHDARLDIRPVCLVDDSPLHAEQRLHGVPVVGTTDDVAAAAERHRAELIVIAVPSATADQMRTLVEKCMQTRLPLKVMPSLGELLDRRASVGALRDVQVEDLLGRPPVSLDLRDARRDVAGRTVLVTGGAGSIGSELARQLARLAPRRLVILDQAESPLYFVHLELTGRHPELDVVPIVADVRNAQRIEEIFEEHRPEYVLHAAAYKHVPLMERHVVEAVRNNVLGTLHVARAAVRWGARRFVLLSTDKAVNPAGVMGATKRVAERLVLELPELAQPGGTEMRTVRFGNVLASEGSVVPLFRRQLAAGGPLTVTHPDVTRYFMTIDEAVQLVLQAASLPETGGRIAMLDMGSPVRIATLAENLIRLSGLQPHVDVQIVYTGLRPAEKLHEDLMHQYEHCLPTVLPRVRTFAPAVPDGARLRELLTRLEQAVRDGDPALARSALRAAVPECLAPLRDAPPLPELSVALPVHAEHARALSVSDSLAGHGGERPREKRAAAKGVGKGTANGAGVRRLEL